MINTLLLHKRLPFTLQVWIPKQSVRQIPLIPRQLLLLAQRLVILRMSVPLNQLTERQLDRVRLVDFHVQEWNVAHKSHVEPLQEQTENAVVETRHEEECCQQRVEDTHYGNEKDDETVKEEVEVVDDQVEARVFEAEGLAGSVGEHKAA